MFEKIKNAVGFNSDVSDYVAEPAPSELTNYIKQSDNAAIVSRTFTTLRRSAASFENEIDVLTSDIIAKIEMRRQNIASLRAINLAISSLAADPSLSSEESLQAQTADITRLDLSDITLEP